MPTLLMARSFSRASRLWRGSTDTVSERRITERRITERQIIERRISDCQITERGINGHGHGHGHSPCPCPCPSQCPYPSPCPYACLAFSTFDISDAWTKRPSSLRPQ